MSQFIIFQRDSLELNLIAMAKASSMGALSLHKEKFQGIPATAIGVVDFTHGAGLIFLSEIKDKPIPGYCNVYGIHYEALTGAIFQLPSIEGQLWGMMPVAHAQAIAGQIDDEEIRGRAGRILSSPSLKDAIEILILDRKGIVAISPEHVIGVLENPAVGEAMITVMRTKTKGGQ